MVIDTSAIVPFCWTSRMQAHWKRKSPMIRYGLCQPLHLLEATIVIEARLGDPGGREFDLWLHRAEIEIFPMDADQADMARRAWRRYGRGRHPAGLNYGDCFSYALAATHDEPLLFKGDDFTKTDVKVCPRGPRA